MYTKEEVAAIYNRPLFALMSEAHQVLIEHHKAGEMQVAHLISYKTGGCPEDCKYCPQAARYHTSVTPTPSMPKEEVLARVDRMIEQGVSRICIGMAWRGIVKGRLFDRLLELISEINAKGVEVCCAMGLCSQTQAHQLKDAGAFAYNHNLDSSKGFYSQIISTRSYEDRLETIKRVQQAGLSLCCGGILGLGESDEDRIEMLHTLTVFDSPPDSIPINTLIPIDGTPLGNNPLVPIWTVVRMIATARILFPKAYVRLCGGRDTKSYEEQALCFFAGANSVHYGDKNLTTPNQTEKEDEEMFHILGLTKRSRKTDACPR